MTHPEDIAAYNTPPPEEWAKDGACRGSDPETFYPRSNDNYDAAPALVICGMCPVRAECLDYALRVHEDHGIWGGTTARERRRRRAALRKAR